MLDYWRREMFLASNPNSSNSFFKISQNNYTKLGKLYLSLTNRIYINAFLKLSGLITL